MAKGCAIFQVKATVNTFCFWNVNILLATWIGMILHTIALHDPRVCCDLDKMNSVQACGEHIAEYHVQAIAFHSLLGLE